MNASLYATVWIALGLFAAGEASKRRRLRQGAPSSWPWRLSVAGASLAAAHIAIAFAARHRWSHAAAVEETARQTALVYGIDWGAGVYVNYLFVGLWLADGWWWRASSTRNARPPGTVEWSLRIFYLVVIVNAAIVFASPAGRFLGVLLLAALVWAWLPRSSGGSADKSAMLAESTCERHPTAPG